jgi:hypothetical protein
LPDKKSYFPQDNKVLATLPFSHRIVPEDIGQPDIGQFNMKNSPLMATTGGTTLIHRGPIDNMMQTLLI